MKRFLFPLAGIAVCSFVVYAQQMQATGGLPTPRLLYVVPMGGTPGGTVTLTMTGQDLTDPETLHFDFPGAKVEPLGSTAAPKMEGKGGKQQQAPILSFKFKVTLPPNAPLGIHDVRVVNKHGISNPRAFVIGDQKEVEENEKNDDVMQAQKIEVNSTINGVISAPTDVDYYQFAGKKGQRVVISCLTTSIDSKLPAALQLYSAKGDLLGTNRAYQNNDAVLDAVLPADGDYQVRVFSFAYTLGGLDYSYRLTVSTAPWIDAVVPSAVEPGKTATLTVYGKNLPGNAEKLTVKHTAKQGPYEGTLLPQMSALESTTFRLKGAAGMSNPFLLTRAHAPVLLDQENNETPDAAQKVTAPCEISGRIDKKNDRDWYAFSAKKGDVFYIDVLGDRLGSPMDLYMQVRSPSGTQVTEQDDNQDILSNQLFTRTDDPQPYRLQATAEGNYKVLVASRDAFTQFGPRYAYQLRILKEQPDFRLIAMPPGNNLPDAATLGQGGHQAWLLHVWRLDGFNEPISLAAEGLPPGVILKPQVVPPGQKVVPLVVSAGPDARPWTGPVKITGTATVKGEKVTREVRGATVSWPTQAINIPSIARMDRELMLAVRDKAPFVLTPEADTITVTQGERINIPVKLTRHSANVKGAVTVSGLALPQGLVSQPLTLTDKDAGTVTIDSKTTLQAGTYTIVLRGQFGAPQKQNQQNPNLGIIQPSSPVTVVVMPKDKKK